MDNAQTTPHPTGPSAPASRPGATPSGARSGKVRPAILLWALGVPIPIVLILLLIRGCM
jgi:hypothetical protein